MGNTITKITDGQLVLVNLDNDRAVGATCDDLSIPCVAEHFTDDGQRLVGIEGIREDGEEFRRLGNAEFLHVVSADDGMGVVVVAMGYQHTFAPLVLG